MPRVRDGPARFLASSLFAHASVFPRRADPLRSAKEDNPPSLRRYETTRLFCEVDPLRVISLHANGIDPLHRITSCQISREDDHPTALDSETYVGVRLDSGALDSAAMEAFFRLLST